MTDEAWRQVGAHAEATKVPLDRAALDLLERGGIAYAVDRMERGPDLSSTETYPISPGVRPLRREDPGPQLGVLLDDVNQFFPADSSRVTMAARNLVLALLTEVRASPDQTVAIRHVRDAWLTARDAMRMQGLL